MEVVLVDTSVWVNFLKGIETPTTVFLRKILSEVPVATCPTVVQEVLQGVSSTKEMDIVELYFEDLVRLDSDSYQLAVEAAHLYRDLRKKGITIRKPNDCLIAAYAIANKAHLLHDDRDFVFIAGNSDLKLAQL